jgi:hypothetical protein
MFFLISFSCKKKTEEPVEQYFIEFKLNGYDYKGLIQCCGGALESGCIAGKVYTSTFIGNTPYNIVAASPFLQVDVHLKTFLNSSEFNPQFVGMRSVVERSNDACDNDIIIYAKLYGITMVLDKNSPYYHEVTKITFKEEFPAFNRVMYIYEGNFKCTFRGTGSGAGGGRATIEGRYRKPIYVNK